MAARPKAPKTPAVQDNIEHDTLSGEVITYGELHGQAALPMQVDAIVPEEALERALKKSISAPSSRDPLLEEVVYEYRKSRSLVRSSGALGLLQRKLQNILFWHALKSPDSSMHQISISEVLHLLEFADGGRTRRDVLEYLSQLQSIKLIIYTDDPEKMGNYTSTGVLSDFHYRVSDGMLIYGISKITAALLSDATFAAKVDLRLQGKFRGKYSLALLEIVLSYLDEGKTPDWPLDVWRRDLGADDDDTYREYRYLNRSVIQPAIKEVEENTGLKIDMYPTKIGRKYESFWLGLGRRRTGAIEAGLQAKASPAYAKLIDVGVSSAIAIVAVTSDEIHALEVAEAAEAKYRAGEIAKPGAWATKMLRDKLPVKSPLERRLEAEKNAQAGAKNVSQITVEKIVQGKRNYISREVMGYINERTQKEILDISRTIALAPGTPPSIKSAIISAVDGAVLAGGAIDSVAFAVLTNHPFLRGCFYSKIDPDGSRCFDYLARRFGQQNVKAVLG